MVKGRAHRAPDVQDPNIPDASVWCGDKQLGTPTKTTGECICKYLCEGRCTRSQGFNFYDWKDGVSGAAKCLPPVVKTEAEKEDLRNARRLENERITRERTLATMNDPGTDSGEGHLEMGQLQFLWLRVTELMEDAEFMLPNIVVAVVVSACFGSVLLCMVIMNMQSVGEELKGGSAASNSASVNKTPAAANKKDD